MKIKQLRLYTDKLVEEKQFYLNILGFTILEQTSNYFTVRIGYSELTFIRTNQRHIYHYCFLIPSNKLNEAIQWAENRVSIITIEDGRRIQHFESWNAESFYFYDASGNIVEFIVRYGLNNYSFEPFSIDSVLCVNEIGLPTVDISKLNNKLETRLGTKFWKGNFESFGTNGSENGLFLMPNYHLKDTWFPTNLKIKPERFEITIENDDISYYLTHRDEEVSIVRLH